MSEQSHINFQRIATAIEYLNVHFKNQPTLDELAEKVNLSPFHFQKMFTEWAGVSPKKFLQYLTIDYAKDLLKNKQATLFDAAFETGLSGTGRLHDLFINIEGMTPGEYKNGGAELTINYSFSESPFGDIIIASTPKGVCYMAFTENQKETFAHLTDVFPHAAFHHKTDAIQQNALFIFKQDWRNLNQIKLHIKGTPFQLKVWETLIKIPFGKLTCYSEIAANIDNSKASRAVGTAIGSNPVAFLIPCHRVIQANGTFGNYRWGSSRKSAIIGWEAAKAGYFK